MIRKIIYQKVNSYLCLALISLMGFWTVLYYATHKASALANSYSASSVDSGY
jgi:hypothetical protein